MRPASSADWLDTFSAKANLPCTKGDTAMRFTLFGASLIALSTPTLSANASPVAHKAPPKTVTTKSVPDMSAVFAMFDKLFPPQPDPDPARLALARTAAEAEGGESEQGLERAEHWIQNEGTGTILATRFTVSAPAAARLCQDS